MIYITTTIVFALVFYIWVFSPLETSDRVGITTAISMVALFIVTSIYSWHTRKMAEEMREQRYDTVRPVLDIQRQQPVEMNGIVRAKEILTEESNLESVGLSSTICNIGLGPAIDTYSFSQSPNEKSVRHNFGVLAVGEKTTPINLSVKQDQGNRFLEVYYEDVYGRSFESRRGVINQENKWVLGPLIIMKL
jgi:hypothetical protein